MQETYIEVFDGCRMPDEMQSNKFDVYKVYSLFHYPYSLR
jgi:hypothetical protein